MDWMTILTVALFLALGGLWVYTLITGKDVQRYIEQTSSILDTASDALGAIRDVIPNDAANLTMAIIEIARTAAANAEQLFLNGSIGKDERKQAARDYAYTALDALGVQVTETIRKIVDGAIEAAALLDIPHRA